jgi:glutamate dehydrogenase (NADP+)
MWRNKPLLRREGDKIFKTGKEACQLLTGEAIRRDGSNHEFLETWESLVGSLGVVFERMPKYAWVMKQLLEPERSITFRVAWLDDSGVSRVNRGYRVQYSSALGPYEGGTRFAAQVTGSTMKAAAFDTTFTNALALKNMGGAFGGADFLPINKSDTEIQRFCQSYMTELSKYIGPDLDLPGLGEGVGAMEMGFMYGQYKRIHNSVGQIGKGILWSGQPDPEHETAQGYGVVYFAKKMLEEKGMSLEGKKCLITGSNPIAMAVAEKLIELGAVPITFSDSSGHIYEPNGFDEAKLKTMKRIKQDRGARVGRYIIASTTAQFNDPEQVSAIPCDLVFPCSYMGQIDEQDVALLRENGCQGVIEGVQRALSNKGILALKKKGMMHGPYRATTIGASLVNGFTISQYPLLFKEGETIDTRVEDVVNETYDQIARTAKEFNTRGDLHAGANITSFLQVANVMLQQGSV